jgi:hypothetical protein
MQNQELNDPLLPVDEEQVPVAVDAHDVAADEDEEAGTAP